MSEWTKEECGALFVKEATPPFIPPQGGTLKKDDLILTIEN